MTSAQSSPCIIEAPVPPISGSASYDFKKQRDRLVIEFPPPVLHSSAASVPVTLLWLPGSGQCPDNEMVRRLANALHTAQGAGRVDGGSAAVLRRIVCVDCDGSGAALVELRKEQAASEAPSVIVFGGHSAGAGVAAHLAAANDLPLIMAGAGPPPHRDGWWSLTILGENDTGRAILAAQRKKEMTSCGEWSVFLPQTAHASVVVQLEGDHSLRFRNSDQCDKDAASLTTETARSNVEIARHMLTFFDKCVDEFAMR